MEEKTAADAGDASAGTRAFGFLTCVDSPVHGVFGGYLLVDPWGRPLEFHCTAPVKVSRAQQILYGATLAPQLHGRNIGATLLAEGGVVPELVFTDVASMLHVRGHTPLPVLLVGQPPAAEEPPPADAIVAGAALVTAHPQETERLASLRSAVDELAATVELLEPFGRIRAAIDEAQRH
jgi:hypothetical protein